MKANWLSSLIRFMVYPLVRLVARVESVGIENVPKEGGYIVAANHLGRLDIPLVYYLLDREDILLLVAEKYRKYGPIRWLVEKLDAIWLDRYNADIRALRQTLGKLKAGGVLVISPEGTRSKTGGLQPAKPGVSYLAAKSGLPVVPVAVTGTEDEKVLAGFKKLKRADVCVRVGKPFSLASPRGAERDATLERNTDEIMCRIAAMLPVSYRGVYAEHPRLKELLTPGHMDEQGIHPGQHYQSSELG